MVQQYAGSCEYHRWRVGATVNGQPIDPTADPLAFALSTAVDAHGEPIEPTNGFVNGVWENPAPTVYLACLLSGPSGAVTPDKGTYYVWMRVTDTPEVPLRLIDTLKVL